MRIAKASVELATAPQFDKIIKNYTDNLINEQTAIKDIMDVENVNLLNIDEYNVGEVLYYAKEDLQKAGQ